MKKKTIEKIPFLTLPEAHRDETVKYVAVTDIKKIAKEPHLFIEVYRKENGNIPAVRIVFTKNDFANFFPGKGSWNRKRITEDTWNGRGMIWQDEEDSRRKTNGELTVENILHSGADQERIRRFIKTAAAGNHRDWENGPWWENIDNRQKEITGEEYSLRNRRRWERRREALKERQENTKELQEERILEYADTVLFHGRHTIFYKRHGARVTVACSKCGGLTDARWKQGQSYESQLEKTVAEPEKPEKTRTEAEPEVSEGAADPGGKITDSDGMWQHIENQKQIIMGSLHTMRMQCGEGIWDGLLAEANTIVTRVKSIKNMLEVWNG